MKTNRSTIFSIENLINLIFSIYFNFRYLPYNVAKRIPILISSNVRIGELSRDSIILPPNAPFGLVRLGLNCSYGIEAHKGFLSVEKGARLCFKGRAKLGSGISIRIDSGIISIGEKAFFNANCLLRCTNKITIGNEILVGWNVCFITDDGHVVYIDGKQREKEKPIAVGNHVWIAADSKIVKGSSISDNSIVAQNSLVNTSFQESNILIGGIPAKILKRNVSWKLH